MTETLPYDYAIIGSGFGGSVSALRLTEKGYRVLLLEKGSRLQAADFPKTNWDVKRWLWAPIFGFRGLFQLRPFSHVQVLAGAGVGGGSLTYANTLPIPLSGNAGKNLARADIQPRGIRIDLFPILPQHHPGRFVLSFSHFRCFIFHTVDPSSGSSPRMKEEDTLLNGIVPHTSVCGTSPINHSHYSGPSCFTGTQAPWKDRS